MTHGTVRQPGQPGGFEAAAARDRHIRRAIAADQQRLQDAVRGNRSHERLELGAVAHVIGLDRVGGDHPDDRSDRALGQIVHVVRFGAHPVAGRKSFADRREIGQQAVFRQ